MQTDSTASHVQMNTQRVMLSVDAAIIAAMSAVKPMMTVPQPETAVKVAAASIVSRMKRRLSIARACISGGSDGRRGMTRDMRREWRPSGDLSSALCHKVRAAKLGRVDLRRAPDWPAVAAFPSAALRQLRAAQIGRA